MMTGSPNNLVDFWQESRDANDGWYTHRPVAEVHADTSRCILFGIFGDDAGVFASQKVLVLLWGSVVVQLLTLDSRMLFSSIAYAHLIAGRTLKVLYEVLAWLLIWMSTIGELSSMMTTALTELV